MDQFGNLQGRAYELGGLAGALCALKTFKVSADCQQQMARMTSRLGEFNLTKIYQQFYKEFDSSVLNEDSFKSALPILSGRLFQGYVQGFCETQQLVELLPHKAKILQIVWIYANPTLGMETNNALDLAKQELPIIADCSDFNFSTLEKTGQCPFADLLFIVRTFHNKAYRFHLICYELSTHNAPTIDNEIDLSCPDDIYRSLSRGKSALSNAIKTREFQIASERLCLEVSPDLKDYFQGLLTEDKKAKKLFQAGGYIYSLYNTIKDRVRLTKPFDKWVTAQNQIEFHVVAFTDRGRHFLHVRENESELLKEMGIIYQGIRGTRAVSIEQEVAIRKQKILKTQNALLRNIRANSSPGLQAPLKKLYYDARNIFATRKPFSNDDFSYEEKITGYSQTAIPPTVEQLNQWLPSDLALMLQACHLKSMQDAHAELVKAVWEQENINIYVLSGTPGIGKTTALRQILANYPSGYLLVYLSPRIQVNTDLVAKFDPRDDRNLMKGKEELICINSNSNLIKAAEHYHGKAALSCCAQNLPNDPKFLFLSTEDAEVLEIQPIDNIGKSKKRRAYKRLETGAVGEVSRHFGQGVFKTIMQAIHRLNHRYHYKRIITCVAVQSNRQISRNTTTIAIHLKKMFGESREFDTASIEQFAKNINELVFFIDEVTGDGAGRQTVQDIIKFYQQIKSMFKEAEKPCPLKIRIIIADASLINATSVESYLNETQSQPDQILLTGNADCKGLSVENATILGQAAKVINANVYPANTLTLRWRPILDFSQLMKDGKNVVGKAYSDLGSKVLSQLAKELIQRWQQKPKEQTIVIIQNKKLIDELKNCILFHTKDNPKGSPDVICLSANSSPKQKRDIVCPASEREKQQKERIISISQKGDLADIIIMSSSGTRGISFPNASKIICLIPTFSLENNLMEFLQGIYRGRGSDKGNQLDREVELIIDQVLVAPSDCGTDIQAKQISNLFSTLMLMRMSILTRIFGACDLFGQSISCIPLSGNLVESAAQTTLDQVSSAIDTLERAYRQDQSNTELHYIISHIRLMFQNETLILQHTAKDAMTLASTTLRHRLLKQFTEDAKRGLNIIAETNYLPAGCYTVGELLLQKLDVLKGDIQERNRHLFETHIEETHKVFRALCAKLKHLTKEPDTIKAVRTAANTLYPILKEITSGEQDSDTESEIIGTTVNRWLVFPISALQIENFWKNQVESLHFKREMKEMMIEYLNAYLCRPHYILPIMGNYDENTPPWLIIRGSGIEQRINAQFQTRYFMSSRSLALLNIMLLAKPK